MENEGKYLVVNAGSSSLKFSVYEMPEEKELINGYVEKIGLPDCFWTVKMNGKKIETSRPLKNHDEAVEVMVEELLKNQIVENMDEIKGVGHRVLHGGEIYDDSVLIDEEVLNNIEDLTVLGPLHHPGQIAGIKALQKALPNTPNVAVFDTAFHQTMPKEKYMYPVPYEWYEKYGVRRYGFHGTSHKYITETMKDKLKQENVNLIICHIGSGASLSLIKEGKCENTTMGLTPLAGLMMGTRSGNIDPSIIEYVCSRTGKTADEVTNELNKKSGLLGVSGNSDLRDVMEQAQLGDEKAILAVEMYKDSIVKYIGQYYFEANGKIDGIVFTAGVGENSIQMRKDIIDRISGPMNINLKNDVINNIAAEHIDMEGKYITKYIKPAIKEIAKDLKLDLTEDQIEEIKMNVYEVLGAQENELKNIYSQDKIDELQKETLIKTIASFMDLELNENIAGFKSKKEGCITADDSNVQVYVIPTNEEIMIARDAFDLSNLKKEKSLIK